MGKYNLEEYDCQIAKKMWVVERDDYHFFDDVVNTLKEAGLRKIHYEEVGCQYHYYALFWLGKKTEEVKNKIKQLKKEFGDSSSETS